MFPSWPNTFLPRTSRPSDEDLERWGRFTKRLLPVWHVTGKRRVGSNRFLVADLAFKPLVSPYIPLQAAQIIDQEVGEG